MLQSLGYVCSDEGLLTDGGCDLESAALLDDVAFLVNDDFCFEDAFFFLDSSSSARRLRDSSDVRHSARVLWTLLRAVFSLSQAGVTCRRRDSKALLWSECWILS